jgi:hypothetical protein
VKYRVVDTLRVRTEAGNRELTRGQVITLAHVTAERLLREGKITRTVRSDSLKTYLWVADDAAHAESLRNRGIAEPIYTFDELRRLVTADEAAVALVHEAKGIFEECVLDEVSAHETGVKEVADAQGDDLCADGPPQCGARYSMKFHPQHGELAAWCRKHRDWCWVARK